MLLGVPSPPGQSLFTAHTNGSLLCGGMYPFPSRSPLLGKHKQKRDCALELVEGLRQPFSRDSGGFLASAVLLVPALSRAGPAVGGTLEPPGELQWEEMLPPK